MASVQRAHADAGGAVGLVEGNDGRHCGDLLVGSGQPCPNYAPHQHRRPRSRPPLHLGRRRPATVRGRARPRSRGISAAHVDAELASMATNILASVGSFATKSQPFMMSPFTWCRTNWGWAARMGCAGGEPRVPDSVRRRPIAARRRRAQLRTSRQSPPACYLKAVMANSSGGALAFATAPKSLDA